MALAQCGCVLRMTRWAERDPATMCRCARAWLRSLADRFGRRREFVEHAGVLDCYETVTGDGVTPEHRCNWPGFAPTLMRSRSNEAVEVRTGRSFVDEAPRRVHSRLRDVRKRYHATSNTCQAVHLIEPRR